MDDKEKKSAGYKAGYGLGIVFTMCLGAIIIALTLKLLFWMF